MSKLPEPTGAFTELTIAYPSEAGAEVGPDLVLQAIEKACRDLGYEVEFERSHSTNQYDNPSLPLTTHRMRLGLTKPPQAPGTSAN